MHKRVGPWRRLIAEELMLSNCGTGEDSLRVPWTARRSNQSILKETNPEYSLEVLMLRLKLQSVATWCKEHRVIRKDPDAGKGWGQQAKGAAEEGMVGRHRRDHDLGASPVETVKGREAWCAAVHGVAKSWAHLVTTGDFNPLHLVSGWKGRLNTSEMNRSLEPWLVLNRMNYLTEPNWHILNRPYVSNSIRWHLLQEPRKMPPRYTTMLNLHVLDLGVYQ